jgi:hypothetical protein
MRASFFRPAMGDAAGAVRVEKTWAYIKRNMRHKLTQMSFYCATDQVLRQIQQTQTDAEARTK